MRLLRVLAAASAVAALSGCQGPDVGAACSLDLPDAGAGLIPSPVTADYLQSGNAGCDNLVCILSPPSSKVKSDPYCSKPCVADSDCYTSDTGLVCRDMVLDGTFLASLPQDLKNKYIGGAGSYSKYCGSPLQ